MKSALFIFAFTAALGLPLAACGGSGSPAKTTEKMDEAKLKQFSVFFPAPMAGWTVAAPAVTVGDDKSMISEVYTATQGDKYSVEITFSAADADKYRDLLNDQTKRDKAGASTGDFGSQTALVFDTHQVTPAYYVAVVGDDRIVSTTPVMGNTTKPIMRAAFEKIDFDGIATK